MSTDAQKLQAQLAERDSALERKKREVDELREDKKQLISEIERKK